MARSMLDDDHAVVCYEAYADAANPTISVDDSTTATGAATVTDANLVVGHIPPHAVFPGLGPIDLDASRRVFAATGVDPGGIPELAS